MLVRVTVLHALTEDALARAGIPAGAYAHLADVEPGDIKALSVPEARKLADAGFLTTDYERYVEPARGAESGPRRRAADASPAGDQPAPAVQQPAGQRPAPAASLAPRAAPRKR
jgi:hypothetical protein